VHKLKHIALVLITLLACVGCDQATKEIAKEHLRGADVISFFGDTIRLQYAENTGAFLGIGSSLSEGTRNLAFTVIVGVVLTALLVYLLVANTLSRYTTIALSLICAGGFGNLIDRVAYGGYVVDFLNIGIGGLRTGIFNVADVAIMVGAFSIVIRNAHHKKAGSV
jgi:signal peptidase II